MWFISLCTAFVYWFWIRPLTYWKNRGVAQPAFFTQNTLPLLGNMKSSLFQQKDIAENSAYFYRMFPDVRYFGFYQFLKPKLIIRDPELIRKITVKDFDYFVDHVSVTDPSVDPLFAKNLISLKGDQWRKMRSTLTSSFSSSKMKIMFSLISESAQKFIKHFEKSDGDCEIDVKNAFSRFTIDVIASTSFGIEVDSMKNPKNDFFILGKEITELNIIMLLKVLLYQYFPSLYRFFNVSMFRKEVNDFFRNLIIETIQTREKEGTYRPDMIQILMEAQKGSTKYDTNKTTEVGFAVVPDEHESNLFKTPTTITTDDISAQALIFFFAGFDSVSSLMTFTAYELAVNENVQDKLREEIRRTLQSCDGKLTYEAVVNMTYMDMVLTESLRKWPPFVILGRECTKPYIIEPSYPGEKSINLPKGMSINVPVYAIHRDPKYYPEPEKFDPERFSPENRKKLIPYTFLAFGQGPRACLGSRFALLEVKILLFHLLNKFKIIATSKTQIPVQLSKKFAINIRPENELWLGLNKLDN
ncbi:cytochrome P450 9e2-like [Anthonomus grandis grandis]|uniref:cytochrome P450 9e2-like n=1 Tax=Anthonomus grandis grandis TaxID=2921223 RepID=UPI0021668241|nr:cytochrome P450 9e2-like [Anthonomus grandis grandis]